MITQLCISRRSISHLTFSLQRLCLVYQNICLFVGTRGSTLCFSFHYSSCSCRFLYNPGNFKLPFLISHLLRFWPYFHHCITASLNFPCYAILLRCHYLPDPTSCRPLNFQTLLLPLWSLQEHSVPAMRRLLRQSSFSLWVQMTLARPAIALYQAQKLSTRVAPDRSFPSTSLPNPS